MGSISPAHFNCLLLLSFCKEKKGIKTFMFFHYASYLPPLVVGIFLFPKLDTTSKLLLLLIVFGIINDSIILYSYFYTLHLTAITHLYILVEFILVSVILSFWQFSRQIKIMFRYASICFAIFWFLLKLTIEPFSSTIYITGSVSNVFLTLSSSYTLFVVLENSPKSITSLSYFWILVGFILYFLFTILPTATQNIFSTYSTEILLKVWNITWIFSTLSHIFYTVGFLCQRKRT